MSLGGTVTVHVRWIAPGELFLWGTRGAAGFVDPLDLKHWLFAWHDLSFYGTLLETKEHQMNEGIALPPLDAVGYFCGLQPLLHAQLEWDSDVEELLRLAPMVRDALEGQRYMPDYMKWRQGRPGWKLDLPTEAEALSPLARDWIDAAMQASLRQNEAANRTVERLEQDYLGLMSDGAAANASSWVDEQDWLTAIGWKAETSPFRVCLQLLEPATDRSLWGIRIVLQDRERAGVLIPFDPAAVRLVPAGGSDVQGESEFKAVDAELPEGWREHLDRVPREVNRWLHLLPSLRAEGTDDHLRSELSEEEAWEFLAQGSERLTEAGCTVLLPVWWERARRRKPRLRAKLNSSAAAPESMFGLNQIVQFDWRLAIGDIELTEDEFRELLNQNRRLVRLQGRWVPLDPEQLAQIRSVLQKVQKKKGLSLRDVLELHLLGRDTDNADADGRADSTGEDADDRSALEPVYDLEVELNGHLRRWLNQLERHAGIPELPPPASFHGTLRRYQVEGAAWLYFLRQFGLGACLADDMGLGKTIQWITYLLHIREREPKGPPSLLVCPTSVLGNWQKELERFAPSLRIHLHYGPYRLHSSSFKEKTDSVDLVLSTYTLLHLDNTEFASREWDCICLDEAQNIKNAYTKQAGAVRRLDGRHRVALTGTPIENRLAELWSIFDFLNPGYLGPLREFTQRLAVPVEREKDAAATAGLQRLIRPFLLRRMKKDPAIQLDLPDKNESKTYVKLTAEQASLYEGCLEEMFTRLDRFSAMERRGHILSTLTKLKQVCNHPILYLKEPITNGSETRLEARSGKVERLLDMASELRGEGDRCLIFTQFVESGHLLQRLLQHRLKEPVMFLHGGTPRAARDELIHRFQDETLPEEERFGVFLLSLKAGGTGLNLTAANHVFHFDRWWNPAVENQATDRAYRIGQTKLVQVHKFVTLGTLEERIDEMIERKMGLSSQIVGGGENWITELSNDELRDLFALRSEWIES